MDYHIRARLNWLQRVWSLQSLDSWRCYRTWPKLLGHFRSLRRRCLEKTPVLVGSLEQNSLYQNTNNRLCLRSLFQDSPGEPVQHIHQINQYGNSPALSSLVLLCLPCRPIGRLHDCTTKRATVLITTESTKQLTNKDTGIFDNNLARGYLYRTKGKTAPQPKMYAFPNCFTC